VLLAKLLASTWKASANQIYYWIGAELSQTSPVWFYEGDGQAEKKV